MDLTALRTVIGEVSLVDVDACRCELAHIRVGRGLLDAREVAVLGRLDELTVEVPSLFPDDEVATASKTSLARASKVRSRKKACADVPELADALANGDTTGDRVDTFAKASAGLQPDELSKVARQGASIAAAAAHATERQYRETIERIIGRARDDDGLDRLDRQRRSTRLRWWTGSDGMWNIAGTFDPIRGLELEGRLRNNIDTMFHTGIPDDAPADPTERHDYLAALALLAIINGTATPAGLPDVTVLIDERTLVAGHPHEHTIIDAGLGRFGLPIETVRRWACLGTVTPVVVAADGVRIYLGRETRLANRAQRRALHVLYRTCALCDVPFEHTQAHHVTWYGQHHGTTDIDNLLPLCTRHHHLVHEGGWQLHLTPDRTLTITRPGGHTSTHAPPRTRAA